MVKISLQNPNLQVRKDSFSNDKTYNEIFSLMRDIKKQFQTIADAVNFLFGPRTVEIIVPLSSAKAGATKIPGWVQVIDDGAGSTGVYAYAFDSGSEEELFFHIHLGDYYTADTDIRFDLHWAPIDNTSGNIVWGIEYYWANIDSIFNNTSSIEVTVAAPVVAKQSTENTIGTITGAGKGTQSILVGRLYRKAADAADTYAADAFGFFLDIHMSKTIS